MSRKKVGRVTMTLPSRSFFKQDSSCGAGIYDWSPGSRLADIRYKTGVDGVPEPEEEVMRGSGGRGGPCRLAVWALSVCLFNASAPEVLDPVAS